MAMLQETEVERHDVAAVNADAKKSIPLYAAHAKVYPKRGHGSFRRFKWWIMAITLGIYYLTPWIRWDRGPYAPDQAVLIDLAHRRFYFFFIEIWPQEFYYVAGLLVMAGVGLFLVTSVVGRAWCGYTCPQTVWVDLFLVVERFFEGDRNTRIKRDKSDLTFDTAWRKTAKHVTWILIAIATGGAWIFYFADAPTLLREVVLGQAALVAYGTIGVLTFTTYVLGGFMREQVCIYMCPWPRIQAAMLDEDSLVVTYNDWRGEPRTRGAKKAAAAGIVAGDCVDCNACVVVCPQGIDIRDGQQLECITCALCIDACNGVMDKLGRERGLISYTTLRDYNHNMAIARNPETGRVEPARVRDGKGKFDGQIKHFNPKIFVRPRTLIYFGFWAAIGFLMLGMLLTRDRLHIDVQHDRNPVFVQLTDGSIRNGYTVKILNMIAEPRTIRLELKELPGATMAVNDLDEPEGTSFDVPVDADTLRTLKVYVKQPRALVKDDHERFFFTVADPATGERNRYEAVFQGPKN